MKGLIKIVHESMMPSNFTSTGRGDGEGYGWNGMWVFALVIIFFALIFWRRDGHEKGGWENLIPAMAMGGIANNNCKTKCCDDHKLWDIERDNMIGQGEIKKEIMATSWAQQQANAQYFYEQQKTSLLGFKDVEIEGLKNTSKIEQRIDQLERTFKEDEIRKQGNRINYLETVLALQPRAPMPAYLPNYGNCHPHLFSVEQPGCF